MQKYNINREKNCFLAGRIVQELRKGKTDILIMMDGNNWRFWETATKDNCMVSLNGQNIHIEEEIRLFKNINRILERWK